MLLDGQNNAVAILQWNHEQGFYVDSYDGNAFRDRWGVIHARFLHPSFYDEELMRPSKLGVEYMLPIFTNAIGQADIEAHPPDRVRRGQPVPPVPLGQHRHQQADPLPAAAGLTVRTDNRVMACSGAAAVLLAAALAAARVPGDPLARLRTEGRLTDGEWRALARGEVVAKMIDTEDRSEVFSIGATRVRATSERVVSELRDREGRASEPWTLQSGTVGELAAAGDFAGLSLPAGDARDLARGRVNDCEVRLPNDAIVRLSRELDGLAPGPREARASAAFRELLAGYAAAYQQRGNPALVQYDNNGDPVRIADSVERLLARSTLLSELAPDLAAFVRSFPVGRPADTEQRLHWARQKFWLLEVISLDQLFVARRESAGGQLTIAVSKQLYATHYYESSLGLTVFLESGPGSGWLFLVNRTRADIRRSGFTWVERLLLNHLVRRRLDARLKHLRAQLERTSP